MVDKLTMRVVWDMLDKITKPLKAIKAQSGSTADALKKTRDELKRLNIQQKQIGEFRELRNGLAQSAQRLKEAEDRVRELSLKIQSVQNPTRAMTREFERATKAARAIKEENQKQSQQLTVLREKLEAAGISTGKGFGQQERRLRADIAAVNAQLAEQQQRLAAVTRQQERMAAARHRLDGSRRFAGSVAGAGVSMIGAGNATGLPIVKTVRDFMTFEDSMLGVAKQVNGARDVNGKLTAIYYDMGKEIKRLATQIPMPTAEIADLVTAGARMGITGDKQGEEAQQILLNFARDTAMMATAFEMPAGEIGDQMGKIAGIFKIDISSELSELGDSINYLDDNAISRGADIISVLHGDLAGAASTIGLRASHAAALASTLLTLGESPERADTAASGMLRQL
ncbi:MAG TPA: phage tail tape measure protein, partial [Herbaspirillum sp.]|nr:phage tail tape measure protein [Herbaspirillum sp.]